MRTSIALLAGAGIVAVLAACSGPPQTFDLATHGGRRDIIHRPATVLVAEPAAGRPLDGDRLVIRRGDGTIAYLTGAQWADRLPRLVQAEMIAAFDGARDDEVAASSRGSAQRVLTSEIRRFEADVARGTVVVEILIRVADAAGHVRACRTFTVDAPFALDSPTLIAKAFDTALARLLGNVATWIASRA